MNVDLEQAIELVKQARKELVLSVKNGTHKQFFFNQKTERVVVKYTSISSKPLQRT